MAAPLPKGLTTAYKRARSQDSPTPLASPPVLKATKFGEEAAQDDASIPAFLRQSQADIRAKFNDLAWKEKLRIVQGRSDPTSKWVQDISPHVMKRNRYGNVQPWDKSRIHLRVAEGKSDYINASPISLRDPRTGVETNYIATQGPKQSGLSHFWHMVWQETTDVAVIVMLTKTHDGTMEKCSQYFPLDAETGVYKVEPIALAEGSPEGSVTFLECSLDIDAMTEIRKLSLNFGTQTKIVWHFLFSGWADFSAPEDEDRAALLQLLKSSAEKNGQQSNPRIVHCSAGVGRTGTYIALEFLLAQLEAGAVAEIKDGDDMVYNVVNQLREQRMMMVQQDSQYQFLYDVLREQLKQQQYAQETSGRPSPKLRKLASGMMATLIGEDKTKDASSNEAGADDNQVKEARQVNAE